MAEKKRFSLWLQKKNRPAGKSSEPSDAGEGGGEQVGSPMAGKLIDIEAVADPVFAQKILGDGVAILPTGGEVYSPLMARWKLCWKAITLCACVPAMGQNC